MKVVVLGGNGQLGSDICKAFTAEEHSVVPLTHADIEISDPKSPLNVIEPIQPEVVVNTAAMHNVEACEADPEKAFAVNALGSRNLALASRALGFTLVHISTDYVFDGSKKAPYQETDCPRPLNIYGASKLTGEHLVQISALKYFIVRVSGLYGQAACRAKGGLNFVRLMLKLARERGTVKVVTDEIVTPTYTADAARQIVALAKTSSYGLFHCTPQGQCAWYDFADAIFRLTKTTVNLLPAKSSDFPQKVPRPSFSVLANENLQKLGLDLMPAWEESLRRYLAATGELKA
jgi:dTDP-4-dehydrorhamnose reductase